MADIDTRRALGIYSKISVSDTLKELITETFDKLCVTRKNSVVCLGKHRRSGGYESNMLKLIRTTMIDEDEEIHTHQLYIIQYIDDQNEPSMFLIESYDIPPEMDDLWYIYPMD